MPRDEEKDPLCRCGHFIRLHSHHGGCLKCDCKTALKPTTLVSELAALAIFNREEYEDDRLVVYFTKGLSMAIASAPMWNDDDQPHDLVFVSRFGNAMAASMLTNPGLVAEVQEIVNASLRLEHLMAEGMGDDPVRR